MTGDEWTGRKLGTETISKKEGQGGHLGPLSARRGVRARNKYGVLHTRMSTKYSTLCACIDRLWDMYVPCTVHVWTAIPCLAPQSNTTQLGREEDDQFASENEKHVARCSSLPRCFLLFLLLLVVRTLYVCM